MPDHDDELAALHDADPVDPATVPSPTGPEATALFERITMTKSTESSTRDTPRRPLLVAASAIAAAALLVAGGFLLTRDDGSGETATSGGPGVDHPPSSEPVTPGGPSSGMCVEAYDLQTLTNREVAFAGTVVEVDGDQVTFTVDEWYEGGDSAETTLSGAETLGTMTSVGAALDLSPGSRVLVAGDGGFAWSCGFTQPYAGAVADQWRATFDG